MATILVAFVVMMTAMAAMAVGVMMGRKPIGGSCGGVAAVGVEDSCACGRSGPGTCAYNPDEENTAALQGQFVDATKH